MCELEASKLELPPRPKSPLPGDCCGSGCTPCVMDIHEQELKMWEKECEQIRRGGEQAASSEVS